MDDRDRAIRNVQRGCTNRDMRKLALEALKSGVRFKLVRSGVMFLGDNGHSATMHYTQSSQRAVNHLRADLRNMGFRQKGRK